MNPFRQLLKAAGGHPPIGTWILSASPLVAEAVGVAGFDWAVIDMEHSPLDVPGVVQLLHGIASTRMVAVVRVPAQDLAAAQRVLDAGALTVMMPGIESAGDAERAVAAMRYPPQGCRAIAGPTRASRYGTASNHVAAANRHVGLIAQIDSRSAVDRLDAICAVEGVDSVFVEPAALAASMGHVGDQAHPAVLDAMAGAAGRCKSAGKPVGTHGTAPGEVAQYRAVGFDYVAIGSDLGLLVRSAHAALGSMRTQEIAHVHSLTGGTQPVEGGY